MILPHPKIGEIKNYLQEYMKFLNMTHKDKESEGFRQAQPVLAYWNKVLNILKNPCKSSRHDEPLKVGFWPRTNHGTGIKTRAEQEHEVHVARDNMDNLDKEREDAILQARQHYVGDRAERERAPFVPLTDIFPGIFVILVLDEEFEIKDPGKFWVARALSKIVEDQYLDNHYNFQLEWWRPKLRKEASKGDRYKDIFEPGTE
jgi:hypothetical protein